MDRRRRDPSNMTRSEGRSGTDQAGSRAAGETLQPGGSTGALGASGAPVSASRSPRPATGWRRHLGRHRVGTVAAVAFLLAATTVAIEVHTSAFQSRWFSRYAQKLTWDVRDEPCEHPLAAPPGPYDTRLGYANLGRIVQKLTARDFQIARQACPSPELAALVERGIAPPYDEKLTGTLHILDRDAKDLYRAALDEYAFSDLTEIPALVVQSLLFVENRGLLSSSSRKVNPAVEWDRFFLAGTRYMMDKVIDAGRVQGGSTLATQIEKFRHSPEGLTASGPDKIRQIIGATLRAYREGDDTRGARREIVLDYVNSMPLGAAPGVGEVIGLGQGMWAYFGKTPRDLRYDLTLTEEDRNLRRKAETFKQALALIMATRRPVLYLGDNHDQLELRIASYLPLLVDAGIVTDRLAAATLEAPLGFNDEIPPRRRVTFVDRKATNAVRAELVDLLDVSDLYTLDRYDLSVETSIDAALQEKVTSILRRFGNRASARSMGLYGHRLLAWNNDPSKVVYSFSLYEACPEGNRLRVSADTYNKPLDINRNVKLELGSTAKLRTMANYLIVIADLHQTLRRTPPELLAGMEYNARDPITRWAAGYTLVHPEGTLQGILDASLERPFSTDPSEGFFTGRGLHYFKNFEDSLPPSSTLRNSFRHSINLVYIRLMRELVQYYVATALDIDEHAVLTEFDSPKRRELLEAAMDVETRDNLRSYYRRYGNLGFEAAVARLCGKDVRGVRRLVIFALGDDNRASFEQVEALARRVYPDMTAAEERALRGYYRTFAGKIASRQDEAYLLGRNPLEVWLVHDRRDHDDLSWADVLRRSSDERRETGRWILPSRFREAQNLRIRSELERRAFVEIHRAWRTLGYPFDSLVPSLATAIGSSADRPQALAELVGIIQRGGRRVPFLRVEALHFGVGTPYETHFEPAQSQGEQVMPFEVATSLKGLMQDVVEEGTARRVRGTLRTASGKPIPVGGKTGSGDNRYETFSANGEVLTSRAINRTASFVFIIGDRYFGMISAYVDGPEADAYGFTSSLALQAFRNVAGAIEPMVRVGTAAEPRAAMRRVPTAPRQGSHARVASGVSASAIDPVAVRP